MARALGNLSCGGRDLGLDSEKSVYVFMLGESAVILLLLKGPGGIILEFFQQQNEKLSQLVCPSE